MSKITIRESFLAKLEELKVLNLPLGEYAITGSGPMAIRGLREANDIDILVKKSLWELLIKKFKPYDAKHIKIGNVEIWSDFINLTEQIEEVINAAEILAGYPFVSLQDTISWKKCLNRKKIKKTSKLLMKHCS